MCLTVYTTKVLAAYAAGNPILANFRAAGSSINIHKVAL